MFWITIEHKSSCDTFFLRYCKNITNILSWVIWTCLATFIKKDNANFKKLWSSLKKPLTFIFRQKINFILHIFFEILQTCYFGYSGHAWLRTPKVILSPCRKLSCLSADKNSTSSFGWDIAKISKLITLSTLGSLSACKNVTSSFTFSMRYCKDIVNLLFWVFCTCLAAHTQNDSIKS